MPKALFDYYGHLFLVCGSVVDGGDAVLYADDISCFSNAARSVQTTCKCMGVYVYVFD